MNRVLIVSPHFPPVNAPDMQRAVAALPHLGGLGWKATVLCVDPRFVEAPRDERLASCVPTGVHVERCGALPLGLTGLAGMRTLGWRAFGPMRRAGSRLIGAARPDLVLFTTTQYPLVLLGASWKRRHGVPFVVDLQDPWVTDYYSRPGAPPPPGGWKYRFARLTAKRLEPAAFESAAGFVSVSPSYLEALARRYAWFGGKPQATIPFGVDEREFELAVETERPAFAREPECVHLVSVGAAGPIMAPGLRYLFEQLRALRASSPRDAGSLRMHFVGTSYAARGAKPSVKPLADALGVGDLVSESTERIPWHVAQATMRAADGVIILGSDEPSYAPSKIAGCFLADRPCLVVAPRGSGVIRLTDELGLGTQLDPLGSTPRSLEEFLSDMRSAAPRWMARRAEALFRERYTALARTRELASFLDRVAAETRLE